MPTYLLVERFASRLVPDTRSAAADPVQIELWYSDGTAGGTRLVTSVYSGSDEAWFSNLTRLDDQFSFVVSTFSANEYTSWLWLSDGTAGGTLPVMPLNEADTDSELIGITARIGNRLFVTAETVATGQEWWLLNLGYKIALPVIMR